MFETLRTANEKTFWRRYVEVAEAAMALEFGGCQNVGEFRYGSLTLLAIGMLLESFRKNLVFVRDRCVAILVVAPSDATSMGSVSC